ncbi:2-hydroxyacyl-CoA dehydratase [Pelotomaculum terephthalicicum JT]|nr:2-hydroxyacyl-CoA dehydratase [Pelotomaculum terephthalicicum]MCG9969843.1 2-hydroxyacyl-CoA dehydratase [Pelotomaculum terephthalicicum JT]OPX88697.1 MAG: 2-hydroxyglutaryl-CoA dehydratase, D-component [Pelotomaculum sp. PtaB.Bin104]
MGYLAAELKKFKEAVGKWVGKKINDTGLLERLKNTVPELECGTRLMIVGSENDDRIFMEMCESVGATFVIEDHCTGSRYFWNSVVPGEDRLAAIAARYVDRPRCPTKDWPNRDRLPHILSLAREWNAQGVIVMYRNSVTRMKQTS